MVIIKVGNTDWLKEYYQNKNKEINSNIMMMDLIAMKIIRKTNSCKYSWIGHLSHQYNKIPKKLNQINSIEQKDLILNQNIKEIFICLMKLMKGHIS